MSHRFALRLFMPVLVLASALAGVQGPSTQAAERSPEAEAVSRLARPDCGDRQIRKPGGGYWRCSFADDFNGSVLNRRKWVVMTTEDHGYQSGMDACFVDDPTNVFVSNGSLKLRTVLQAPFTCEHINNLDYSTRYTSGSLTTGDNFTQTYGRYEFRVRFPAAKRSGLHSAVNRSAMSISPESDLAANKPFDMPFSVPLTQALGIGWNPFRAGWTPLPATMTVDYVRVWR